MTATLGQVVSSVANFLSGAETSRPTSPEYLEVTEDDTIKANLFLVTYGPYGILPSFDPDCLTAIVSSHHCEMENVKPNRSVGLRFVEWGSF